MASTATAAAALVFVLLVLLPSSECQGRGAVKQRLYGDLLADYYRVIPPDGEGDASPVEVTLDLFLTFVTVLSSDKVDMDGWLMMTWKDPRLAWNKEHYNVSRLRFPQDYIWTPDIAPLQNLDIRRRTREKFQAVVEHDGSVLVVDKLTYTLPCSGHSGRRTCEVSLGSWTHAGDTLDVQTRRSTMDTSELQFMTDYRVSNTTARRVEKTFSCCPETFPVVTFTFTLQPQGG